ncbi:MAG: sulfotransferase [Myxococcota bacterium]
MIFITGLPRSGTSLTCTVLDELGLHFGPRDHLAKGKKRTNPTGMMENRQVRQRTLKPILETLGADPAGQHPLPPRELDVRQWDTDQLRERVLGQLGGAEAYKDAKLVLVWPLWTAAFPDARWVIVRRDREDVVNSCLRTYFMRRHDTADAWREWAREYEARLFALRDSVEHVEVWPGTEPEAFRKVAEFVDLEWSEPRARTAIRPEAWHG